MVFGLPAGVEGVVLRTVNPRGPVGLWLVPPWPAGHPKIELCVTCRNESSLLHFAPALALGCLGWTVGPHLFPACSDQF